MKLLTPYKVIGFILVAYFILSRIYEFPTIISSVFAICWFLYVPYSIGSIIFEVSRRHSNKLNSSLQSIGIVMNIVNWFVGIFAISAIVYSLIVADIPIANIMGTLLLLISVGSYFVYEPAKSSFLQNYRLRIILILIIGIAFGLYVRSFSPYPLSPGIDVFNHMYVIENILNNSYKDLLIYFPSFDVIIALSSSTFNADLNSIFWIGSILMSMIFSISCYAMLLYFLRNNAQAILGTVIALPLTEMAFASNLQFFYPASFVISIFPLMFFSIDFIWKKLIHTNKIAMLTFTAILFLNLIFIHIYLGFVMVIALSIYIFGTYYLCTKDRIFFIFRLLTIAFSLILLAYCLGLVTFQFKMDFIEGQIFKTYGLYNTATKVMNLQQWYTIQILLASVIGFILLSFYKNKKIVILNFIGIIMFLAYFQQISDIHRIMPLERPFIALGAVTIITLPIFILVEKIKNNPRVERNKKDIRTRISHEFETNIKDKYPTEIKKFGFIQFINYFDIFKLHTFNSKIVSIFIIMIFAFIYPLLLLPFDTYTDPYTSLGYNLTNYTFEELDASKWIKDNIPENYKIYSDPSTVIEMRGLSDRPHIEGIGWNITVAREVRSVLLSENAGYAYQNILTNQGENTAIVITPRTSEWLTGNTFFTQLPIKEFKYFEGVQKFFDKNYFKLEYSKDKILIFTPTLKNRMQ